MLILNLFESSVDYQFHDHNHGTQWSMPLNLEFSMAPTLHKSLALLFVISFAVFPPSAHALGDGEIYALNAIYNEFQTTLNPLGWSNTTIPVACTAPALSGLTCNTAGNVTAMYVDLIPQSHKKSCQLFLRLHGLICAFPFRHISVAPC